MPEISIPFRSFSARKIRVDSVTSRCSSTAPKRMPKANYSIHDSILLFLPLIIMGEVPRSPTIRGWLPLPLHSTSLTFRGRKFPAGILAAATNVLLPFYPYGTVLSRLLPFAQLTRFRDGGVPRTRARCVPWFV
jgi:hypothetical protein